MRVAPVVTRAPLLTPLHRGSQHQPQLQVPAPPVLILPPTGMQWPVLRIIIVDVSTDNLFGSFVPGYQNLDVGTALTLNVTGLTAGITYYYRVRASDACGTSINSNTITYATLDSPATPVANAGSGASCTGITANWSSSAGATTYYVDVSTVNTFASFVPGYNDLNVGNTTSLAVTGLTMGTTYYYRVRAENSCGTSVSSNVITYAALDVPAVPVATAGSGATCNQITVNWSAAANATGYFLDVSTDNAFGSFVGIYDNFNAGNVTTVDITGLTTGTTYYYRVRATNTCGTSINSNVITYATLTTPLAPLANSGSSAQCTQFTANWGAVAGATSYRIDVATDAGFTALVFGHTNQSTGNVTTFDITGLTAGVTYYYRVRAITACGTSPNSNVISYATLAIPATPEPIGGATTLCANTAGNPYSVTLDAAATGYIWAYSGTGATINGSGNSVTIDFSSIATSGTLSVTASNACGSSTAQTLGITINPLPAPTITAGGPTTFCAGGSVTLTASSASSYLWSDGETNQSITVNATGNYSVTVTDANGCSATSAATVVTVNALPVVAAIGGSATVCTGSTSNYTNTTGGGTWSVTEWHRNRFHYIRGSFNRGKCWNSYR